MATSGVGYLGFQPAGEMQAESLLPIPRTLEEAGWGRGIRSTSSPELSLKPGASSQQMVAGCLVCVQVSAQTPSSYSPHRPISPPSVSTPLLRFISFKVLLVSEPLFSFVHVFVYPHLPSLECKPQEAGDSFPKCPASTQG